MDTKSNLGNEKGMALIGVYLVSTLIALLAGATQVRTFYEIKAVNREITHIRSLAASEAALQSAMAQVGQNAYTGFINTSSLSVSSFRNVSGQAIGSYSATLEYPDQADWIIIRASGTIDGETKNVEGRVFLDSNLSKYLVYVDASDFSSGAGAQYGTPDSGGTPPTNPQLVTANENDRASMYMTGNWTTTSNVNVYGDVNAAGRINGDANSTVHGDVYTGAFTTAASGAVTNSGVLWGLKVGDGFADDKDRNKDGQVTAADYPDYHDLTAAGGGDNHQTETLTPIDNTLYKNNNNIPTFGGATAKNRYLKFVSPAGSTTTTVQEYNSTWTTVANTYSLPSKAIVYVNGSAYVKGQVGGRVSVVSSSDIYFDSNVSYSGGQTLADPNHSVAFMAKKKLFFRANQLDVSGILYAENSASGAVAFDSDYNTAGAYSPGTKTALNLYGNRIIKGATNLSNYPTRTYAYDPSLKYYRPPGIPVVPRLRTVREV